MALARFPTRATVIACLPQKDGVLLELRTARGLLPAVVAYPGPMVGDDVLVEVTGGFRRQPQARLLRTEAKSCGERGVDADWAANDNALMPAALGLSRPPSAGRMPRTRRCRRRR